MEKTNLIDILSNFDVREMKDFADFVSSPYFNRNKKVIDLFTYLKKIHPEFPPEKIKKEIVFKKLFPKKEFNDGFLRLLIHNLNKLAEDFISLRKFEDAPYLKERFLLEYFVLDKKLPKLFEKKYNSTKEKNSKTKIKDADYFLNEYEVEILYGKYKFLIDDNFLNVTDLPKEENLRKTESLKKHFFITILNQYRFLLNTEVVVNVNYRDDFREVITSYINEHPEYLDTPILKLHYLELFLLYSKDEKYFYELKDHFIKNYNAFSWLEKFSSMSIMENYCLSMIYKGVERFFEEKHSLHKLSIKNKLFSKNEGGKIFETDFQNIVSTGIRVGKTEWVKKFIEEHKDNLEEKNKENVLNIAYARLYLVNKDFDNALKSLNNITEINDINFKVAKRGITLEIYYEKGLIVEAFNLIDNFKHFIANDKLITQIEKERLINYVKFINQLLRLKSKINKEELYVLEKELTETQNVYSKRWLLRKLEELQKVKQ